MVRRGFRPSNATFSGLKSEAAALWSAAGKVHDDDR